MSDEYDKTAQELGGKLPLFRNILQEFRSAQMDDQLRLQQDLASKTLEAIGTLKKLAQLLNGNFKPSRPPQLGLDTTLRELESTWKQAETTSEACLDNINHYSDDIIHLYTALEGWYGKANILQSQVQISLARAKNYRDTERDTLQTLEQSQRDAESVVYTLQQRLCGAHSKYANVGKFTCEFPETRRIRELLKPIIESCKHDLEGAEKAVDTAMTQVNDAKERVRDEEAKFQQLSDLDIKHSGLMSWGLSLIRECSGIIEETRKTEEEMVRIKTTRVEARQLAAKCVSEAERTYYAPFKADYATSILKIINVALVDHTLAAPLAEVVQILADHDDSSHSVREIATADHPDGLLAAVQKKLQEAQADGARPSPTASASGTILEYYTHPNAEASPQPKPETSSLAVAHFRLVRSVATALAAPRGMPGNLDLFDGDPFDGEKRRLFDMLHVPLVAQ
ncbi:ca2+ regulator and membrane fusion fig1 domain [Fusarium longipes]|uniref:Ca2+ regulator and membrane fusion fig1 domain n=1 Tax=Fusarium longipes TaxID=694270 RepID=A0A395T255_9HYPO|nr:ca2+ regulator and membrane fusion fig1 domain [Fusarium longipes]